MKKSLVPYTPEELDALTQATSRALLEEYPYAYAEYSRSLHGFLDKIITQHVSATIEGEFQIRTGIQGLLKKYFPGLRFRVHLLHIPCRGSVTRMRLYVGVQIMLKDDEFHDSSSWSEASILN
jgi:hypothetical protein